MIRFIWNNLLYIPILNFLLLSYFLLGNNLGLAILALTLISRVVLLPLILPSMKAAMKQKELAPELEKLRKKYKDNKRLLAEKQMEMYKKHGFNPASGCLPNIIMIFITIALYRALSDVVVKTPFAFNDMLYFKSFSFAKDAVLNTKFLYLDLAKKDPYLILPVAAALSQLVLSKISMPQAKKMEKLAEKTSDKSDDVMYNVQNQMVYMMPIMTVVIGLTLPSGIVLYWFATTFFQLAQQWIINKKQLKR